MKILSFEFIKFGFEMSSIFLQMSKAFLWLSDVLFRVFKNYLQYIIYHLKSKPFLCVFDRGKYYFVADVSTSFFRSKISFIF